MDNGCRGTRQAQRGRRCAERLGRAISVPLRGCPQGVAVLPHFTDVDGHGGSKESRQLPEASRLETGSV